MKIAVLAGGLSPEHDVSMASGALVANALKARGHFVALCDVYLPVPIPPCAMFSGTEEFKYEIPPEPTSMSKMRQMYADGRLIGDGVVELCRESDVVFTALHGGAGEDGHIQAMLEMLGIPFTGSDMASCRVAIDKHISKLICHAVGIETPPCVVVKNGEDVPHIEFPAVIKPCSCGSSVGMTFVYESGDIKNALDCAFRYEDRVMIEKKIDGREFSVSVLGSRALPSVEILPRGGTYDFLSKYKSGLTEEICPGRLDEIEEDEIERLALAAHNALGLGDYSRSDFIYGNDGRFYYLETNALPGMTNNSLLPMAARAVGIEYGELCEKICVLAYERKKK